MDLELETVEIVPVYLVDLQLERGEIVPVYLLDLGLETSVADPDPFGSVSFWSAISGSASMKRIRILVAKNQPKSWKISTKINKNHFSTIKLMFTDMNIYSINNKTDHISEKYIFYRKKKLIFSRF